MPGDGGMFPFIEGPFLGPLRDSLLIEYAAMELASEGLRIRLGPREPSTGVPMRLGGPRIEAGIPIRLMSPPVNRGNLRSSSYKTSVARSRNRAGGRVASFCLA